jgi:hypothetical protein
MAGEIAQLIQLAKDIDDSLGNLPTLAIGKGGEIVFTELFKNRVSRLFRRFSKAKEEGKIPPDFETTEHGQSLLQEALNALWEARDQRRAEAIQNVFLGLAMNPAKESLAQVQQFQALRLVAEMSLWEVMLCSSFGSRSLIKEHAIITWNRVNKARQR